MLLNKFQSLFSKRDTDVRHCNTTQHKIDTGDNPPIIKHSRWQKVEVQKLINEIEMSGVIKELSRIWASPAVLGKKKVVTTRFCIDYMELKDVSKKDTYPLPRNDDKYDVLNESLWVSMLDLKSRYWQVEVRCEDREKIALPTRQGHWQVIPAGLY